MLDIVVFAVRAGLESKREPVYPHDGNGLVTTRKERCVKSYDKVGSMHCFTISALDLFCDTRNIVFDESGYPDFRPTVAPGLKILDDSTIRKDFPAARTVFQLANNKQDCR
jgi:hypothetical protein